MKTNHISVISPTGQSMVRVGLVATAFALACGTTWSQDANACDEPGEAPDVVVSGLGQVYNHGTLDGLTAYSVETIACNFGTCWAEWDEVTNRHPVISQNMYRIKDGRLQQLGQGWLKHGFFAFSEPGCSNDCVSTPDGTHLGVNCSDPYDAFLNGFQNVLGPKFQINPLTGEFPYPHAFRGKTGNLLYKRIQIPNDDLDPTLNPGATYMFEGHYVTPDDAMAGEGMNNATTRLASTFPQASNFGATLFGNPQIGKAAIEVWPLLDASVDLERIQIPGEGRLNMAAKVTDLGAGQWHYEYAVHNLNSHQGAKALRIPLPSGATVSNVGFFDVAYHSGEVQDGTDWSVNLAGDAIEWSTVDYETNPAGNAVNWGTTYNFWFDSDAAPSDAHLELALFGPGSVSSMTARITGPGICDNDGTCDAGESCDTCANDCGGSCCGDGVCDAGETSCSCYEDCGLPTGREITCDDGVDDDCDGLVDCQDSDCCGLATCGTTTDSDADGATACNDCRDDDNSAWDQPGTVGVIDGSKEPAATYRFVAPTPLGGSSARYYGLRTLDPSSFIDGTICIAGSLAGGVSDTENPPPGEAYFYLIQAVNSCLRGSGGLGPDSSGVGRVGRECE